MSAYANNVRRLSERVLRIINAGNVPNDSRFGMRDVEYMVRDVLGSKILASWSSARANKEALDISDSFISTITKDVEETIRKECFVDLDFDWVNIPDGSGIQSCRPSINNIDMLEIQTPNLSAFIPIPARFDDIYRNLPAQSLEGQVGWLNRGKKIFFTTVAGQTLIDLGVTKVDIDVVSTSEAVLGQDKTISIPSDIADAVVKEVAIFFVPAMQAQKDMLNDNNPNIKPVAS